MPGVIETRHHEVFSSAGRMEEYRQQTPLGRNGTAEEVAQVVLFLASGAASFLDRRPAGCQRGPVPSVGTRSIRRAALAVGNGRLSNLKSSTVATLFLICDALDVRAADIVRRVDAARKRMTGQSTLSGIPPRRCRSYPAAGGTSPVRNPSFVIPLRQPGTPV
jgi:hypothetical protein